MSYPDKWSKLFEDPGTFDVPPARYFKPPTPDYRQFIDVSGREHIAVRSVLPYGVTDLEKVTGGVLLRQEMLGADYSVFAVPDEMASMQQIVAGSGVERMRTLQETFRALGQFIGRLLSEVPAPGLALEDIGIDRSTGSIALIPPVELGSGATDGSGQLESISRSLVGVLDYRTIAISSEDLVRELTFGLEK